METELFKTILGSNDIYSLSILEFFFLINKTNKNNRSRQYLLNTYNIPDLVLSSFHGLAHLILKNPFDFCTINIRPTNTLQLIIGSGKI